MLATFLRDVRVLDLSQYLPGPFATRTLGDMGADVVKVEPPQGDPLRGIDPTGKPGTSPFWEQVNAGKTVVTLDLKDAGDAAAFTRLAAAADVLLESYRPGVLDRLGFGNDRLAEINPRLIHCALSGFGQTGPLRITPGHDLGYVALTGGLDACGTAETPVIPFPPMADYAGADQAVIAILGALIERARSGRGCFLDIGMADALMLWNAPSMTVPLPRAGGIINGGAAFYQIYRTGCGRFVTLSPIEPKFWANFCTAVGRPDWIGRQFEAMPQTTLIGEVAALFASQPLGHWEALLPSADCCYQAVLTLEEVPNNPHVRARGFIHRRDRFVEVLFPALVDGATPPPRAPVREDTTAAVEARWSAA